MNMKAKITKVERESNGRRNIYVKFPPWVTLSVVTFLISVIVYVTVFVVSTEARLKRMESLVSYQLRFDEAVKKCEWENHNKDILDKMPSEENITRGGSFSEIMPAKHEELLTIN